MLRVVSVVLSVVVLALSVEVKGLLALTVELGGIPSVSVVVGDTVVVLVVVGGTVVVSVAVGGSLVVSVEEGVEVVNTTVPVCIQKYPSIQYTLLVKQLSEDVHCLLV